MMKKQSSLSLLALALLFLFSSCNEFYRARQITGMAGGKTTSYSGDFMMDVSELSEDEVMQKVEQAFSDKGYNLSSEKEGQMAFENSSSPVSRQATGKFYSSNITVTHFPETSELKFMMRLSGNYGYGKKEKAQKILDGIEEKMFEAKPE